LSVTIHISPSLSQLAGQQTTAEVNGTDIRECLNRLVDSFPGLRSRLFDGDGGLKSYVEIYINRRSCYPYELTNPVEDGDQIQIVEAIAGG
jgi:molybdopterin converting factor small subunit